MSAFGADVDDLAAFTAAGRLYANSLAAVLDSLQITRSQVLAATGHSHAPADDGGAFENLLRQVHETNRFVASIETSLRAEDTSTGFGIPGTHIFQRSGWFDLGGVGDGGPILDWLGAGTDFVAQQAAEAAKAAARQASELADATDDAIVDAVPFAAAVSEAVAQAALDRWYGPVATGVNRYVAPVVVQDLWRRLDALIPDRPTNGDSGGTFTTRGTGARAFDHQQSPEALGRAAIVGALHDTADGAAIRNDEFQLIRHDANTYTVVLAGVVDLTNPTAGLDESHLSSRDTDAVAARSFGSVRIEDNLYAAMVYQSLILNNVPRGADLMIVGHSLGADTALDLASAEAFNGGSFNVTHVVAAAYHSEPQLRHVQPGTQVLVLQNNKDIPVMVENLGHWSANPFEEFLPTSTDVVVREFDGGWAGFGHHQDNYTSYLEELDGDSAVATFFTGVAESGYGKAGDAIAIDVSLRRTKLR